MLLQFLELIQHVLDLVVTINSVDIKFFWVVIILFIGEKKRKPENFVMCPFENVSN